MMKSTDFLIKLKDVKLKDVLSIFAFLIAYPCAKIFKHRHRNLWLVCEEENEARDNGYWFYKYIVENKPMQEVAYAINKKSVDYAKLKSLGTVIQYGGLKHWIYYLAAKYNISSQKGGKPNAALCYLLEITGILKNKRIFLQHGVTINDLKWLYYDVTKFDMFICSTKPEFEYVSSHFGYPNKVVEYLGFSRFDNLHKFTVVPNRILIMPTWRNWLKLKSKMDYNDINIPFEKTAYFMAWEKFITSRRLSEISNKYNLEIIFYPHRNMQSYLSSFKSTSSHIKIADWKKYEIQELLKSSALMITDYSSVFFDFVYMKKPVVFYQFDIDEFRQKQYQQGYFDYFNNPFATAFIEQDDVLDQIETIVKNKYMLSETFISAHCKYFEKYDNNNSQRIFDAIKKKEMEEVFNEK